MVAEATAKDRLVRAVGFRLLDAAGMLESMEGEKQQNVCEIGTGTTRAVQGGGHGCGGLGGRWLQNARRCVHALVANYRHNVINILVTQ